MVNKLKNKIKYWALAIASIMIISGFTMLFIPQNSVNAKFTNANPSVSPSNFYITNKTFNFTDYNFNPNYAQGQMPTYVIINGYLAIFHFGQDTTTAPTTNGFAYTYITYVSNLTTVNLSAKYNLNLPILWNDGNSYLDMYWFQYNKTLNILYGAGYNSNSATASDLSEFIIWLNNFTEIYRYSNTQIPLTESVRYHLTINLINPFSILVIAEQFGGSYPVNAYYWNLSSDTTTVSNEISDIWEGQQSLYLSQYHKLYEDIAGYTPTTAYSGSFNEVEYEGYLQTFNVLSNGSVVQVQQVATNVYTKGIINSMGFTWNVSLNAYYFQMESGTAGNNSIVVVHLNNTGYVSYYYDYKSITINSVSYPYFNLFESNNGIYASNYILTYYNSSLPANWNSAQYVFYDYFNNQSITSNNINGIYEGGTYNDRATSTSGNNFYGIENAQQGEYYYNNGFALIGTLSSQYYYQSNENPIASTGNMLTSNPEIFIYYTNSTLKELPSYHYHLQIKESGLNANTQWSYTFNNNNYVLTNTSYNYSLANGSYAFTVSSVSGYSLSSYISPIIINGANITEYVNFTKLVNPSYYKLQILENGLPSNTEWTFTLSGINYNINNNSYNFSLTNGTYTFSANILTGYSVSYKSPIVINGANKIEYVNFTINVIKYTVRFAEYGLPSGANWYILIDGQYYNSTTSTIIIFLVNGYYSYSVQTVLNFTASYNSAFTVNGQNQTLFITFTANSNQLAFYNYFIQYLPEILIGLFILGLLVVGAVSRRR